jgi:acetolactate synthase-1/3 small subunit
MLNILVVYVENKPGVLSRVISLFRRRNFNIDSLTVGRTEKPDVSRMTMVVEGDADQVRRIVANVYKLVNVLLVDDITGKPSLIRDLALIKVNANQATRSQVLDIANVFKARVLDLASESITMEMTGGEEKVDRLLEILTPFGLLEVVRTGAVAMRRGAKSKVPAGELPRPAPSKSARHDDSSISYSV